MRISSRIVLGILVLIALAPVAIAEHLAGDCPLSLVGDVPSADVFFGTSPHGVFRDGSIVYLLRGRTLTTLNVNDVGNVTVAREDVISELAARETDGGVAFSNGFLYVTSEAGLEIFDLRNVVSGGNAPIRLLRVATPHYQKITVSGNVLAALYPRSELPCNPIGSASCFNSIDLFNIADVTNPQLITQLRSSSDTFVAFNDIAFANGFLYATGVKGTWAFDVTNLLAPAMVFTTSVTGEFLVTNGSTLMGIGQETRIGVFTFGPGARLNQIAVATLPTIFDRGNQLMFHPEAAFDGTHLVTLIDEKDPRSGDPARTVAFDVFDLTVPFIDSRDDRIYENVSYVDTDQVLHDPLISGPFVFVNGELTGAQTWGACGQIAGGIEFDSPQSVPCGGGEIRGFVTGAQNITRVEVFLDNGFIGNATIGRERYDMESILPVYNWRVSANLDSTTQGEHLIRVIGTDSLNNRRQFASRRVYFQGPGKNCTTRRRGGKR